MGKLWQIAERLDTDVLQHLIKSRGIVLDPPLISPISPITLTPIISRIKKAIRAKESIVVYADYDADGICAGAIMWETLWKLGARVMPYIPHRVSEGYGLSQKGIDAVRDQFDPSLIITVDHGITAWDKVEYAKSLGIEVIVTDHHVKPNPPAGGPDCLIVHTTETSGSGVSWLVAKALFEEAPLELAAIGTIADLLPLIGLNRAIVKQGLAILRKTKRVGLKALIAEAGITDIDTYAVSHILAPRLNAMGRLEHALDALRLLCTNDEEKARLLAEKLGLTNRERQKLTEETYLHAHSTLNSLSSLSTPNLIFLSDPSYNPGVIGLVAGRLVEEFYRPAIVLSVGDGFAKASARSIPGFNIVEAIRSCSELLVDVGGHPMAAGFTVETKNIKKLSEKLQKITEKELDEEKLTRVLKIDAEIPLEFVTEKLWKNLQELQPFGFGNPEPVFATMGVKVVDTRLVGKDQKHLKLRIFPPSSLSSPSSLILDCIAFNLGKLSGQLPSGTLVDLAYSVDLNIWNGRRSMQLKVKDIRFPSSP